MDGRLPDEVLIIGIGNIDRGDDGVGNLTVQRLRTRIPVGIRTAQVLGEATDLIGIWQTEHPSTVYVVDATCCGIPAGTIQRFEAHHAPLPAEFTRNTSTHALGLAEAIELARLLDDLPKRLIVYGIEGLSFDFNAPLSPAVEAASLQVVERILKEIVPLNESETRPADHPLSATR